MITNIELAYHTESWGLDDYVTGLRHISDAGFTGVEVLPEVVRSFSDRVLVFREMLEEVGLRLSAVEAVMESLNEDNIEEAGLALLRYADFAEQAGASILVVRPPYRAKRVIEPEEYKFFFGFISEVGKGLAKKGIRLCVRPDINTVIEKRTELEHLMSSTPKSSVWLCPDTGYLLLVKISPVTLLKNYAKRIGYFRLLDGRVKKPLKSTWRRRHPAWRAVGKGAVKIGQVIKALDKSDYEGWVCATHPAPAPSPAKACRDAANSLEKALDALD